MTDADLVSAVLEARKKGEAYRDREEIKQLALSEYLGDFTDDFDLDAIIDDAYLIVHAGSGFFWVANPEIDEDGFAEIVKSHDLS